MSTMKPEREGQHPAVIAIVVIAIVVGFVIGTAILAGIGGGDTRPTGTTGVVQPAQTVAPPTPTEVSQLYRVATA